MIALIPARLDAHRLPAKPLSLLGGAPLIVRVCENAAASGVFSRIVVASDSESVIDVVIDAGFEGVVSVQQHESGTDRVAAAARQLVLPQDSRIINVQGDEPFVEAACLEALASELARSPNAVITPRVKIDDQPTLRDPNAVKVVCGTDAQALYFSRASIPYVRDRAETECSSQHFRHIGVYGYTMRVLQRIASLPTHPLEEIEKLEQLRWLAQGEVIRCPIVGQSARGVDTAQDLIAANIEYDRRQLQAKAEG